MANKDYAKTRRKKTAKTSHHGSAAIPSWFWLLTGILLGLLIAGILYLKNMHQGSDSAASTVQKISAISHVNAKGMTSSSLKVGRENPQLAEKNQPAKNQPRFDFYTMLPKMQVENSANSSQGSNVSGHQNPKNIANNVSNNAPTVAENNNGNFANIDPAQSALNRFETPAEKSQDSQAQNSPSNNAPIVAVGNQVVSQQTRQTSGSNFQGIAATNSNPASTTSTQNSSNVQQTPTSQIKMPSITKSTTKGYLVLVQQLQSNQQADQIKAALLLAGFDVKVESVNLAGRTLNRILLGPFTSVSDAHQAKKILEQQNLHSEIKTLVSHQGMG